MRLGIIWVILYSQLGATLLYNIILYYGTTDTTFRDYCVIDSKSWLMIDISEDTMRIYYSSTPAVSRMHLHWQIT